MEIRLVVKLYSGVNFTGVTRYLIEPNDSNLHLLEMYSSLDLTGFGDKALSIAVHPGPDYQPGDPETVSFFEHDNFNEDHPEGKMLVLGFGAYPDLNQLNFGGVISSVKFNGSNTKEPGVYVHGVREVPIAQGPLPTPFTSIPVVAELFNDAAFNGKRILLVESSTDIVNDFGEEFKDTASSLVVSEGFGYKDEIVRLYEDIQPAGFDLENQVGGSIDFRAGLYYELDQRGFKDRTSAVYLGSPLHFPIKEIKILDPFKFQH